MHDLEPTVFVLNADKIVLKSLELLVNKAGLKIQTYDNPQDFLDAYDRAKPGCLVLDEVLPGMSGLDLQYRLLANGIQIPVIFLVSGRSDVSTAVKAMKAGAVDFIEKPIMPSILLDSIERAFRLDAQVRSEQSVKADIEVKISLLTARERGVIDLLVSGKSSKMIAHELGISQKTVGLHLAHILEKMGVDSVLAFLTIDAKGSTRSGMQIGGQEKSQLQREGKAVWRDLWKMEEITGNG
jgi:FixJ family two-component response regulator